MFLAFQHYVIDRLHENSDLIEALNPKPGKIRTNKVTSPRFWKNRGSLTRYDFVYEEFDKRINRDSKFFRTNTTSAQRRYCAYMDPPKPRVVCPDTRILSPQDAYEARVAQLWMESREDLLDIHNKIRRLSQF